MRRPALAALLAIALSLAAAGAAAAASRHQWATVNVCDTDAHPDMLGVRGRMAGDGTRARMWMRFAAQYSSGNEWLDVGGRGTSPWISVGSAAYVYKESGYTFRFKAPGDGKSYLLRGRATFEWRERRRVGGKLRWVVVKRRRAITEAGHRSRDADPTGFTAATCDIAQEKPTP